MVAAVINNTGLTCEGLKGGETAGNETEAKFGSLDSGAKLAHWCTAYHAQGAAEAWREKSMASPLVHSTNGYSRYSVDISSCTVQPLGEL